MDCHRLKAFKPVELERLDIFTKGHINHPRHERHIITGECINPERPYDVAVISDHNVRRVHHVNAESNKEDAPNLKVEIENRFKDH